MARVSDQSGGDQTPAGDRPPRSWALVFEQLFDPHPSNVALVALDGTVLAVNAAWRQYGRDNGLPADYGFVGRNYLAVCEAGVAARYPMAEEAYLGLLGVMRNDRPKFTMVYPCHTPARREWYRMWVEPQSPSVPAIIVAHQLVESKPWVGESGADAPGWPATGGGGGGILVRGERPPVPWSGVGMSTGGFGRCLTRPLVDRLGTGSALPPWRR